MLLSLHHLHRLNLWIIVHHANLTAHYQQGVFYFNKKLLAKLQSALYLAAFFEFTLTEDLQSFLLNYLVLRHSELMKLLVFLSHYRLIVSTSVRDINLSILIHYSLHQSIFDFAVNQKICLHRLLVFLLHWCL